MQPTHQPNRSPTTEPVRFILTADWQLGMTRHFLEGEAQARFAQARIDAIRTIGRLAAEQGALFVGVGGDVFETNQVVADDVPVPELPGLEL